VHAEIAHIPHRESSQRTVGLYTVVMDMTARKLAEKVMSESEQRFRSIADSAHAPNMKTRSRLP
jgi:PAS domain-containing protein